MKLEIEIIGQAFQLGVVFLYVIQLGDLGRGVSEQIGSLLHGQALYGAVRLLDTVDQGCCEGMSESV